MRKLFIIHRSNTPTHQRTNTLRHAYALNELNGRWDPHMQIAAAMKRAADKAYVCVRTYVHLHWTPLLKCISATDYASHSKSKGHGVWGGLSCVSSPLHFRLLTCCGTSARQCSFPLSAHLSGKSVTVFNHPHTNNRPAFEPLLLLLSRFSITALPHCSSAVLCVWAYRIVCCARKLPKTLKASQRIQLFSNCGMQMCYYMPKLLIRHVWRFGLMHCKSR